MPGIIIPDNREVGKMADILKIDSAPAHNALYRGKDLTDIYTLDELSAKLEDGDFSDLYIGDYITKSVTINGTEYEDVKWRFADFDYFLKTGDTECTSHHIVMVPDIQFGTSYMNSSNTTSGGYVGSYMWTTKIPQVTTGIQTAFGSTHTLSHKELLTNSVNTSAASSAGEGLTGSANEWAWYSVISNLMNEVMVYGCHPFSSSGRDIGNRKKQLALFRLDESSITTRAAWWLSSVCSSTAFCSVGDFGYASYASASNAFGVRPYFLFV